MNKSKMKNNCKMILLKIININKKINKIVLLK